MTASQGIKLSATQARDTSKRHKLMTAVNNSAKQSCSQACWKLQYNTMCRCCHTLQTILTSIQCPQSAVAAHRYSVSLRHQLYCSQQMLTRTHPLRKTDRQDLSCTYLAHHELKTEFVVITICYSPIVGDARGDLRHAVKGAKHKTPALVRWRHSQQDNDDD